MKTIVVIDDNAAVRLLLEDCLKMEGHNPVSFSDGQDIEAIKRTDPDLIILDLVLPGKSGLDILRELRADGGLASVPVMVISASVNLRSIREEGVTLLEKPFDIEDLFGKVSGLLTPQGSRALAEAGNG